MCRDDVALLIKTMNTLYDWSGAADDTPDDTEVLSTASGLEITTVGELRDLMFALDKFKSELDLSKDGLVKIS